jgi:NitT/TauT family transport system permease protein
MSEIGATLAGRRPVAAAGLQQVLYPLIGVGLLLLAWAVGGWLVARNPDTRAFAGFAPGPALGALADMLASGAAWKMTLPSLARVGQGLLWAILIGVPIGVLIGWVPLARRLSHVPFQFLRMISPLAWMPIAVLAFPSWDGAIVFLIAAAAVWPVTFATANGLKKMDPQWFKVARNLGAGPGQLIVHVILPATAQDILTGVRLALGVAWIVLVPAEYLGVTSGLGYAINDARDTLEYDRLAAVVVLIGAIGFALDGLCLFFIRRYAWQQQD